MRQKKKEKLRYLLGDYTEDFIINNDHSVSHFNIFIILFSLFYFHYSVMLYIMIMNGLFLDIEVSNSSDYDTSALLVEQRHMWDSTTDTLHWPCLCLYPASHVSEMILDFSEDTTLLDHLRVSRIVILIR